jgi:hypothetical protein
MKNFCKNHDEREAISICHCCSNYYCRECLDEGPEYYYCKNDKCQQELKNMLTLKAKADILFSGPNKDSVYYEFHKSKIPFYLISLFVTTLLGLRYARLNKLDIAETVAYILGASIGLWGFPILITFLLGVVITRKELRSKIFLYIYAAVWIILVVFMMTTFFSTKE